MLRSLFGAGFSKLFRKTATTPPPRPAAPAAGNFTNATPKNTPHNPETLLPPPLNFPHLPSQGAPRDPRFQLPANSIFRPGVPHQGAPGAPEGSSVNFARNINPSMGGGPQGSPFQQIQNALNNYPKNPNPPAFNPAEAPPHPVFTAPQPLMGQNIPQMRAPTQAAPALPGAHPPPPPPPGPPPLFSGAHPPPPPGPPPLFSGGHPPTAPSGLPKAPSRAGNEGLLKQIQEGIKLKKTEIEVGGGNNQRLSPLAPLDQNPPSGANDKSAPLMKELISKLTLKGEGSGASNLTVDQKIAQSKIQRQTENPQVRPSWARNKETPPGETGGARPKTQVQQRPNFEKKQMPPSPASPSTIQIGNKFKWNDAGGEWKQKGPLSAKAQLELTKKELELTQQELLKSQAEVLALRLRLQEQFNITPKASSDQPKTLVESQFRLPLPDYPVPSRKFAPVPLPKPPKASAKDSSNQVLDIGGKGKAFSGITDV